MSKRYTNELIMKIVLYTLLVLTLVWLFTPVFSFAQEGDEAAIETPKTVAEEAVEAIENTPVPNDKPEKTVNDLLETASKTADPNAVLKVSHAWAKPTLAGQEMGVVFLTLENTGDKSMSLIGASSPAAGRMEIHTHIHVGEVMQMRQLQRLDILPHSEQVMKPGGLHLMLFEVKDPLTEGSSLAVTLKFSDGSTKKVTVPVQSKAMGSE